MYARGRRRSVLRMVLSLALMAATAVAVRAGEQSDQNLREMTLDELLSLELVPLDVLGRHTHLEGEWMIGYHFGHMSMPRNRDGSLILGTAEVLRQFPVSPTNMTMEMHMLHGMYAPSDRVTLSGMLGYKRLSMSHATRSGGAFVTEAAGFGDLSLGAMVTVLGDPRRSGHRLAVDTNLLVPTGSVDVRGDTPAGSDQKLPYPMQLGAGTPGLRLGLLYLGQARDWAWSTSGEGLLNVGSNDSGYRLGNSVLLRASCTRRLARWAAVSVELAGAAWGDVTGSDPALNPRMVPTADPDRRGGNSVALKFGLNFLLPGAAGSHQRVALEVSRPIHQSLDGPQLETGWRVDAGLIWTVQ